jgi:membrane protease YdiL (CAAX protease family)
MKVLVQVLKKNRLLLVFTCLTAGITEEIIFRGLPRLEILLKIKIYQSLYQAYWTYTLWLRN